MCSIPYHQKNNSYNYQQFVERNSKIKLVDNKRLTEKIKLKRQAMSRRPLNYEDSIDDIKR